MKRAIKIFFVMIILLSFSGVFAATSQDYEYLDFYKKDSNGNPINNAKFKQTTLDGYTMIETIVAEDNTGNYTYASGVINQAVAYKLLSPAQKTIIDKLLTLNDYNLVKENLYSSVSYNAFCEGKNSYVNYLKESKGITVEETYPMEELQNTNPLSSVETSKYSVVKLQSAGELPRPEKITLYAQTYSFIEEVRTPQGLEKTNIIVPMTVIIDYNVEADDTLTLLDMYAARDYESLLIYNPQIDYTDVSDVYAKMTDDYVFQTGCGPERWKDYNCGKNNAVGTEESSVPNVGQNEAPGCDPAPIVIDKKSNDDLTKKVEISAYMDGKKEITVKKNTEVTISVKLVNGANTPLYTNKVISKVPSGLVYVEGSDPNNGVYDSQNNTVTWTVDYIDSMDTMMFSYKVRVPDNVVDGSVYKTSADLTTFGYDTPIVSDQAQADYGNVQNPKTGSYSEQLICVLLAVSVLATLYAVRKSSIKGI